MSVGTVIAGAALALGLVGAAWVGGQALIAAQAPVRAVTVKGLAERPVEADIAAWRLAFRGEGAEQAAAIADAARQRDAVRAFALAGGLSPDEIAEEPFTLKVDRVFYDNGQSERLRFSAVGALRIRTPRVDAVAALSGRTLELLAQGVRLGEGDYAEAPRPLYVFTGLNAVKPAMIADATRSARAAADQFAADSGARVGAILSANQGVVQVLARDGDYPEQLERWKTVRVVSTVEYALEE